MRQIALNLLSNSIKFTGAGGQVIVSTALNDEHEVVLRVRDTGHGMSEKELQTALEPFRQIATSARWGASGTGLGLPITKALAEANHARFRITSAGRQPARWSRSPSRRPACWRNRRRAGNDAASPALKGSQRRSKVGRGRPML